MEMQVAAPALKMQSIAEAVLDPRFPYHVYLHDGIAYTPDVTAQMIQDVQDFPAGDTDIFVAGYPKSGTNWLNITLASLYPYWETTKGMTRDAVPELTVPSRPAIGFRGFAECLAAASPRLTKTHVPYEHMPRALRQEKRGRAIYITRNPKDVCESYFAQISSWYPPDWGWQKHLAAFLEGNVFFGSWLRNVTSWHAHGATDNVLHIGFEEMQHDKRCTIKRIVDFVGPVPTGTIDRVIAETEFKAMQSNGLQAQYQPQMLRREGKSGGWKKRFTVAESERLDAAFGPTLRDAGITIDWGD